MFTLRRSAWHTKPNGDYRHWHCRLVFWQYQDKKRLLKPTPKVVRTPLASLLKQVQDLISQIQAKPQELMEQNQIPSGSNLGGARRRDY